MYTFRITTALTGTQIIQATDYVHARQIAENELYNISIAHNTNYNLDEIVVEGKYKFPTYGGDVEIFAVNFDTAHREAMEADFYWANCTGNLPNPNLMDDIKQI
jgi:hypothetical protein